MREGEGGYCNTREGETWAVVYSRGRVSKVE